METLRQAELGSDILHPAIISVEPDVAVDNSMKILAWRQRAAAALNVTADAVPAAAILRAALEDLKATGQVFQGVYRAVIAYIMDSKLSRKQVKQVAELAGFPDSRVSEFCRIAFAAEPIRKGFIAGASTFRAALRSARDTSTAGRKARSRRVAAQTEMKDSSISYDVVKAKDSFGMDMLKITILVPVDSPLVQPVSILPEGQSGALRWNIHVSQI